MDRNGFYRYMTGARIIVGAQAVAVISLLVMALAAAEKRAVSPPEIRGGVPVVPRCPPPDRYDYFYPDNALFPRNEPADADTRAYLSQLLRAAETSPLWCGAGPVVAYRLMVVFEWGRTKVITMHRTRGVWMLDAVEFRHPSVARFSVDRRESLPLSSEEAASVTTTLEADRFWRLPSNEPEQPLDIYDGPHWFVEGRSAGAYHLVLRAWDRDQIIRSARRLMQLARMTGEENTAPPGRPPRSAAATSPRLSALRAKQPRGPGSGAQRPPDRSRHAG